MSNEPVERVELLERAQKTSARVKVFPLPTVVLFPHTAIPLHIFEPRYKAMIEDALATDNLLCLAQIEPGADVNAAKPVLSKMACIGVISLSEKTEDGRYFIMLTGVTRVRFLNECTNEKLYREMSVEVLPDSEEKSPSDDALRQGVLRLCSHLPEEIGDRLLRVASHEHGGALVDVVASAVTTNIERRYTHLCELNVDVRVRGVLDDISDVMAKLPERTKNAPQERKEYRN